MFASTSELMFQFNFQLKLQELHVQMQATRERSLKLISEKDSEIQYLRSELQGSGSLPSTPNLQHKNLVSGSFSSISEETLPQSSTQLYSQENSMGEGNINSNGIGVRNILWS